ncbi:MAG: hypothetical protein A2X97_04315 [Bdellovibrionales bacterium GWA1_52_35]|nr:MAG: hypothetical protein A2X97_04315 [Bdellovibrionales bacterium GWA1_52_35]
MNNDVNENDLIHLGSSEYNEAKRLQALLAERGVSLSLLRNPENCSTGCKITVEVYTSQGDLDKVREFFREQKTRAFDGLAVDEALLDEVYDPEKGTARCPACATEFSTTLQECPDCGLVFAS